MTALKVNSETLSINKLIIDKILVKVINLILTGLYPWLCIDPVLL